MVDMKQSVRSLRRKYNFYIKWILAQYHNGGSNSINQEQIEGEYKRLEETIDELMILWAEIIKSNNVHWIRGSDNSLET